MYNFSLENWRLLIGTYQTNELSTALVIYLDHRSTHNQKRQPGDPQLIKISLFLKKKKLA